MKVFNYATAELMISDCSWQKKNITGPFTFMAHRNRVALASLSEYMEMFKTVSIYSQSKKFLFACCFKDSSVSSSFKQRTIAGDKVLRAFDRKTL